MTPPDPNARELLTSLLRDVSRSFYLTLRMLPGGVRAQVSLAYLLARTTDTIADTELVPVAERLAALEDLRAGILGQSQGKLNFHTFTKASGAMSKAGNRASETRPSDATSRAERVLLERVEESLAVLRSFSAEDQRRIRDVLETITSGQQLDLQRFGNRSTESAGAPARVAALATDAELDDYTYRVAGCVGEFWTRMCRAHLFPAAALDDSFLLANGVRFGKGLQLVNILRDLPADLHRGCCYLPRERLAALGLQPADLLKPANEPRLRPAYNRFLDLAEAHLAAGWAYTNALPWRQVRVRLACAWPLLIGIRTVGRLRDTPVLDRERRVKIRRAEVRQIVLKSVAAYPFPPAWRRLFPARRREAGN